MRGAIPTTTGEITAEIRTDALQGTSSIGALARVSAAGRATAGERRVRSGRESA